MKLQDESTFLNIAIPMLHVTTKIGKAISTLKTNITSLFT